MPAGVWIGQVFQYFSGFVTISFEKTASRIPLWSQKNNLEQKKVFLWKLQPRPWGFLISFFVSDICYKKGDRSPGDHVARVNEIFNSRPVWMFLKVNFQFQIFQGIFSINSRKTSPSERYLVAVLNSDPTLVPNEMYPLLLSISID